VTGRVYRFIARVEEKELAKCGQARPILGARDGVPMPDGMRDPHDGAVSLSASLVGVRGRMRVIGLLCIAEVTEAIEGLSGGASILRAAGSWPMVR
jgi:hypothetical protein